MPHTLTTHTLDAKRVAAREGGEERRRSGALQLKHSHYAAAGPAELPATAIKEPKIAMLARNKPESQLQVS